MDEVFPFSGPGGRPPSKRPKTERKPESGGTEETSVLRFPLRLGRMCSKRLQPGRDPVTGSETPSSGPPVRKSRSGPPWDGTRDVECVESGPVSGVFCSSAPSIRRVPGVCAQYSSCSRRSFLFFNQYSPPATTTMTTKLIRTSQKSLIGSPRYSAVAAVAAGLAMA